MTEEQIKRMTQRFLMWKLPANFNPDNGISVQRPNYAPNVHWQPVGTNLLDFTQAEAMVRFIVDGIEGVMTDTPTPSIEEVKERLLARDVVRRGKTVLLDIGDGPKPVSTGDVVRFRNPDGPAAHAAITALQSELAEMQKALERTARWITHKADHAEDCPASAFNGGPCDCELYATLSAIDATLKDRPNTAKDG